MKRKDKTQELQERSGESQEVFSFQLWVPFLVGPFHQLIIPLERAVACHELYFFLNLQLYGHDLSNNYLTTSFFYYISIFFLFSSSSLLFFGVVIGKDI